MEFDEHFGVPLGESFEGDRFRGIGIVGVAVFICGISRSLTGVMHIHGGGAVDSLSEVVVSNLLPAITAKKIRRKFSGRVLSRLTTMAQVGIMLTLRLSVNSRMLQQASTRNSAQPATH